jgi:hypothetical protein
MHCHGINMPCCPPSGSSSASCSGAQCIEQIPQKSETPAPAPVPAAGLAAAFVDLAVHPSRIPAREMTSGLRYQTSVFLLKDDLRI